MKNSPKIKIALLLVLVNLLLISGAFAQAPQGFNYQATVRNNSGQILLNQIVLVKFKILQNSATGDIVYSETHTANTDDLGQINLVVGQGTASTGTFSTINWGTGNYYLGIELNTGSGYVAMGTTQLMSVPYALYANSSGNSQSAIPSLTAVLAVNNSANSNKITNLADPIDAQDAVTKGYVQNLVSQIKEIPPGNNKGDMLYWNGTNWVNLNQGANGQILTYCNGEPKWTTGGVCPPQEIGDIYHDYTAQYNTEIADIETYLKTNYISVINNPGFTNDQDVTISKITAGETSIWDQTSYQLKSREVNLHGISYKVYYLVLREGKKNIVTGLGGQSPSNSDAVLASYSWSYLQNTTATDVPSVTATLFEESKFPNQFFSLLGTIKGWGEIFPQFKTGSYDSNNDDGTVTFTDFGAGVMFIPSGLAYFQNGPNSIPSYAPLVFSFKLYEIQRLDSDGDGILNYQEDLNGDGYMYDYRNLVNYPTKPSTNPDDTDGDGIPNFVDIDDDGDNYTTKLELKKTDGTYHTFETVPSCSGQTVKRYLTANCKPPYAE